MEGIHDRPSGKRVSLTVGLLLVLLIGGVALSLFTGLTKIDAGTIIKQWWQGEETKELLVFQTLRFPRAVLSVVLGANLAVAGVIMQAITRNPLASPQVFGVNAGASLVVVASIVFLPSIGSTNLVYFAFAGALFGGFVVFSFSSSRGMTNVKIALVGMAVHLLFSSMTKGLIIFNEEISDVLSWLSGSISGASWGDVRVILPWSIIGLVAAFLLSRSLSIFQLGEEVAIGLGQGMKRIRITASIAVILLAGSAVAVAGAIGFIGLMVPHITRKLVGEDHRILIPVSALAGAVLLLYADVVSRYVAYPYESPVGL
ncbi:iron (III) dicitrate ABC transporter permease [Halobacillus sp. BAB-2008]|nr:iron (III) dicitrate ABC transporter permease [Halobacillus sp. BAB-2008]